jgi:uncharacterized membrane protein HdeD (DUF308 family)
LALTNGANQINTYLVDVGSETQDRSWVGGYLLLGAVSGVLYGLVAADVSVFSLVSELQVGAVIVLAFGIRAISHYLQARRKEAKAPEGSLIQDR